MSEFSLWIKFYYNLQEKKKISNIILIVEFDRKTHIKN